VATPPYAVPTGREIALHALAIDRAANLPVMLYNYPGRMGVNMDEDTLDRLGRSPNFCAIKESSGDINRLHMLARDYPHIRCRAAWTIRRWNSSPGARDQLGLRRVELRARGAYRVVPRLRRRGRFHQGAARIMSAMMPLMRVLEQGGKFVQCIKHGLTLRGIDAGPPRKPLRPLNKDDKRELAEVIRTMTPPFAIEIEGGGR
jgi:4-hydroxy-tetrahydrodipicolinate synthase